MSRKLQKDPTLLSFVNTDIVLRAFIVAIVLGSVLTLANQPGAIFGSDTLRLLPTDPRLSDTVRCRDGLAIVRRAPRDIGPAARVM